MNSNQPQRRKAPELANGQSRADGDSAGGEWVTLHQAALRGVALMAGPLGGKPFPAYHGVTTTAITGGATHEKEFLAAAVAEQGQRPNGQSSAGQDQTVSRYDGSAGIFPLSGHRHPHVDRPFCARGLEEDVAGEFVAGAEGVVSGCDASAIGYRPCDTSRVKGWCLAELASHGRTALSVIGSSKKSSRNSAWNTLECHVAHQATGPFSAIAATIFARFISCHLFGRCREVGPDQPVVVGAEVLAGNFAVSRTFDCHATGDWNWPLTAGPVGDIRRVRLNS